jgi:predicted metal-dependent hydrolase
MTRAPAADDSRQLSLWSDEPPAARSQTPPPPPAATKPTPSRPIGGTLTQANFSHPRSNREARLGGHRVAYELRRVRRKSIGFVISNDGLVVSAPRWVPAGEIESALQEKSRWILKKLQEQDERARRLAEQRIVWQDGTSLPFLGETVIVVLDARAAGAVLHTSDDTLPGVPRLTLHVGLPEHASAEQIRDLVQSWLQRQAKRVFEERCHHFARQLGVRWTRLSLSSASTRWGSASADGAIRLHWRLIHFALPTIDYVVAHELAHLRVMDHSPRFWDVVRSVIPDVDRLREGLRDELLPTMD